MKIFYYFSFLFLFSSLGYYSGLKNVQNQEELEVTQSLSENENKPVNQSLSYAISVATDQALKENGISHTGFKAIETALENSHLSEHEKDLWKALGTDDSAASLRDTLIIRNHATELPGTELYIQNKFEELQKNPQQSLEKIQNLMNRIPASQFPTERASLLEMMEIAAGKNEVVKSAALHEMTQTPIPARPDPSTAQTTAELNAALSTSPSMILPITAHLVFLRNTSDPTEAFNGTLQGILSQPDRGVRIAIASQYIRVYPERKSELKSQLINQGIDLSFYTFEDSTQ